MQDHTMNEQMSIPHKILVTCAETTLQLLAAQKDMSSSFDVAWRRQMHVAYSAMQFELRQYRKSLDNWIGSLMCDIDEQEAEHEAETEDTKKSISSVSHRIKRDQRELKDVQSLREDVRVLLRKYEDFTF